MPEIRMNSLKSLAMNCGPLSELIRGRASECPLQDDLDVSLGHRFPDVPVDDEPAETVQHAAQVVERRADVEVGNIDVPVLMCCQRLREARALLRRLAVPL